MRRRKPTDVEVRGRLSEVGLLRSPDPGEGEADQARAEDLAGLSGAVLGRPERRQQGHVGLSRVDGGRRVLGPAGRRPPASADYRQHRQEDRRQERWRPNTPLHGPAVCTQRQAAGWFRL